MHRRIDNLNRLTIPMEILKEFKLGERAKFQIITEERQIVLVPEYERCFVCGEQKELMACKDVMICTSCSRQISRKT